MAMCWTTLRVWLILMSTLTLSWSSTTPSLIDSLMGHQRLFQRLQNNINTTLQLSDVLTEDQRETNVLARGESFNETYFDMRNKINDVQGLSDELRDSLIAELDELKKDFDAVHQLVLDALPEIDLTENLVHDMIDHKWSDEDDTDIQRLSTLNNRFEEMKRQFKMLKSRLAS